MLLILPPARFEVDHHILSSSGPDSTVQSTVQCKTVLCSAVQCSFVYCSVKQCNVQCTQCSRVLTNTAPQVNTTPFYTNFNSYQLACQGLVAFRTSYNTTKHDTLNTLHTSNCTLYPELSAHFKLHTAGCTLNTAH